MFKALRKIHFFLLGTFAAFLCGSVVNLPAQGLGILKRNEWALGMSAVDQNGVPFTVGGLSGIDWIGGSQFVAIMDNSDKVVFVDIRFECDARIQSAEITGGITLTETGDFECIAWTDPGRNSVWLGTEVGPAIREYDLATGAFLQELSIPTVYTAPGNLVPNFGFEALGRRADGAEIYVSNEEALTVDGTLSTPAQGSTVRLCRFIQTGNSYISAEQYAYRTRPMQGGSISGGRSGLVELVTLPDGTVLGLERSLAFHILGVYSSAIFELDFSQATDVSQGALANGLIGQSYQLVQKNSLWSTRSIGQNLEGFCLGPALPTGNFAMVGICDDGDALSSNTLVAFQLSGSFGGSFLADWVILDGPAQLVIGDQATLNIDRAPSASPFFVLQSFSNSGLIFQGHPFDVDMAATIFAGGSTDADGRAQWLSPPVPASASGRRVYVEVAVRNGCLWTESNLLSIDVL